MSYHFILQQTTLSKDTDIHLLLYRLSEWSFNMILKKQKQKQNVFSFLPFFFSSQTYSSKQPASWFNGKRQGLGETTGVSFFHKCFTKIRILVRQQIVFVERVTGLYMFRIKTYRYLYMKSYETKLLPL